MLFKSALLTAGSGKLRGIVASHNKGGAYLRGLTIPTNPQTALQTAVRNSLSALSTAWSGTLTALQRAGWNTYAGNLTWTNALGDAISVTGQQAYVGANAPRLQGSLSRVDAPPVVFTRPTFSSPTLTLTANSTNAVVAFNNADAWAIASGGALLVYASPPQGPGINSYGGPYKYIGKIAGAVSPPTSPATLTLASAAGPTGSKVFFRVQATAVDGRLSPDFRFPGTV